MAELGEFRAERARRLERRLGGFVGDEFEPADQPDPARLADQRVVSETPEPRLESRRSSA